MVQRNKFQEVGVGFLSVLLSSFRKCRLPSRVVKMGYLPHPCVLQRKAYDVGPRPGCSEHPIPLGAVWLRERHMLQVG